MHDKRHLCHPDDTARTFTGRGYATEAVIEWRYPLDDGGLEILSYKIESSVGELLEFVTRWTVRNK